MKRPIVRLTGVKAGGGRERARRATAKGDRKTLFLSLFPSSSFRSSPPVSGRPRPHSRTALHCTALLTPTDPLFLFSEMASQTSTHCGGSGGGREGGRPDGGRTTPSTPFSLFPPPLIHSSQLKGGRKEGRRPTTRRTATQEVFPLSLSPSLSLSLSLSRFLSQSPRRAACPPLMPAARSSFEARARARACRQASD